MTGIRNAQLSAQMLDFAHVQECFEQTLLAYKQHRWADLIPYLASEPRRRVLEALKTKGEGQIIESGQLPDIWQYQQAMPVSAKRFHVFALMANRGQDGNMDSYRFIFVRSRKVDKDEPRWLLWRSQVLGETEYQQNIYKCLQWAPEYYYYPEDREDWTKNPEPEA